LCSWACRGLLRRPLALLTRAPVAAALFILNMWLWHMPPVYNEALVDLPLHVTMHVAFMATGLIFWWPVVQPVPDLGAVSGPARLLYLFVTGFPMEVLAMLLIASTAVVYDYYATAPRQWGISAIEDQQIAGVIMGVFGQAAAFIALSLLFVRYLDDGDEADRPPEPIDVASTPGR
jgi:putative membrane protein